MKNDLRIPFREVGCVTLLFGQLVLDFARSESFFLVLWTSSTFMYFFDLPRRSSESAVGMVGQNGHVMAGTGISAWERLALC